MPACRLVFLYGTLRADDRVAALLDSYTWAGSAVLEGLHRVEGRYPTLAPGGSVGGRLLETPDLDTLDDYEGVDRGLYVRVSIPFDDRSGATYIGDPAALDAPADWPGDGPFRERVHRYIDDHAVRLRRR